MSLQSINPASPVLNSRALSDLPSYDSVAVKIFSMKFIDSLEKIRDENKENNQEHFLAHPDAARCLRILFQFHKYIKGHKTTDTIGLLKKGSLPAFEQIF